MLSKMITVFTPTYNRAYILHKCYDSLCKQTCNRFEWLIVDDGSTDDTEIKVMEWIKEKKINIKYVKQNNSGKHIAHNRGVIECESEIFVCVDSDDFITNNAIEEIYNQWKYVEFDDNLAGIIALKGYSEEKPISSRIPNDILKSSIFNLYDKYRFKGDAMLVFKTSILKENLFPHIPGEKFMTEAVIYDKISRFYEMHLLDKVLYICEYLSDGYTSNISNVRKSNPQGHMLYLYQRICFANSFKDRCKAYSYYLSGCFEIKNIKYIKNLEHKYLIPLCIPKSIIIYLKPKIKRMLLKSS
ncbi:glycosyltransferase family 2 protein [Paraclostridium sordellii]